MRVVELSKSRKEFIRIFSSILSTTARFRAFLIRSDGISKWNLFHDLREAKASDFD
jgi:hypothetical protein